MRSFITCVTLLVVVVAGVFQSQMALGAEPKIETVITIEGMHCPVCAKKIVKKLEAVKPVASAKADAMTGKATVLPTKGKTVSAKLLWEAVEAAGYKPTRLEGPSGTFTKKPKA